MVQELRDYIRAGKHKTFRCDHEELHTMAREFSALALDPQERMTRRFERLCALETPVILPGEQITFLRTVKFVPDIFTPGRCVRRNGAHGTEYPPGLAGLQPGQRCGSGR